MLLGKAKNANIAFAQGMFALLWLMLACVFGYFVIDGEPIYVWFSAVSLVLSAGYLFRWRGWHHRVAA